MQALILAAGMAERLRPITNSHPKCLVEINGKTFIERMINNILYCGITDINVITGFEVDKVKSYLKNRFPDHRFNFYHNSRYYETNNCYSLWLGKHLIHDDFLLFDADIIFDYRIIKMLIDSEHKDCLALRVTNNLGEEEIKVRLDHNNRVLEISKVVDLKLAVGESIGIEKFSMDCANKLFNKLEENILKKGLVNDFYEKTFEDIIKEGANIYAVNLGELKCAEVDFVEDIHHVEKDILPFIKVSDKY